MEAHFAGWDEHVLALAVERATEGLEPRQERELRAHADARDLEDFELAVASLHIASLGALERPPADLVRRIEAEARRRL
jgi:hypothetical protein